MDNRITCTLSVIKIHIIYGHIRLVIWASSTLKDDLQETQVHSKFLATCLTVTVFTRSLTAESVWPGILQLLSSLPQPDAMNFPGYFSFPKHYEPNCFGPHTHWGPLYLLNHTCGTRTADTLVQCQNTRSWSDEPCLHVWRCWPRCKDSDHLKNIKMINPTMKQNWPFRVYSYCLILFVIIHK